MLKSLGLRAQLALLVAAALAPLFLLMILSALGQRDAALAQARASLLSEARLAAARQQRLIDRTGQLLQAMASAPAIKDPRLNLCGAYLGNLLANYPGYLQLALAAPDGRLVCQAARPGDAVQPRWRDQAFFRAALAGQTFVMGEYVPGRGASRPRLSFGTPVHGADGALAGVALATLDATQLERALAADVGDNTLALMLTDRGGTVIAALPGADGRVAAVGYPAAEEVVRRAAHERTQGVREAADAGGARRVYAFAAAERAQRVGAAAGPDLQVAASLSRDSVLAQPTRNLLEHLGALALALLLGVTGAWAIGARMFVRPARQMLRVVHRVEAGDLDARVDAPPAAWRDELSRLARAINRMAGAMQARQQRLDQTVQESAKSQALLSLVINSMREGVVAVDLHENVLLSNAAVERFRQVHLPGDTLAELRQWIELYHPDGVTPLADDERPLVRAVRGESVDDFELLVRAEDVDDRVVSCSIRPLRDGQAQVVGGLLVFHDITARKSALRLRARHGQVLELIAGGAPLADVLDAVALMVEANTGALASVMRVQGDVLRLVAAPSLPPALREALAELPLGEGGGACGAAASRREMVVVVDVDTDALAAPYRELATAHGLRACWSVPVMAGDASAGGGEVLATFALYHRNMQRPGPQMLELIDTAARLVRIALERDRAVEALRGSEARFRELAETIDDVFYVRELAGDTLLYVSPAYERLWGRGVASVLGQSWSFMEAVDPDDIEAVLDTLRRQREGASTSIEYRIQRPDGTRRWVRNDAFPVVRPGGAAERIVGTVRDVTQRKQAELNLAWTNRSLKMLSRCNEALVRLDDELRLLNEICRVAVDVGGYRMVWVGNAQQDGEQLIVPVAHAGDEQGYLADISLSWRDDEPRGQGPGGRAVRSGRAVVTEDITREDAGFVWKQEALARGFRSLICLPLREGGRSFGLLALYGPDTHPVDADEVQLLQELADNLAFGITTIRERRRAQAEILRLNAVLEQRVRQRTSQLEEANRELEAFSYSVAHDLRAPLSAIEGFSAALSRTDPPPEPERAAHYLRRVRAGVRQMEDMIEALLNLARISRADLRSEWVDLSALARGLLDGLREQAPQRELQARVADGLRARGDARLLKLVLENLLGNAWKFTATREQAVIEVGRIDTGESQVGAGADGDGQTFFVRDNGVGFDMAYAHKLFSAFQRLHGATEFPGIGLGLANVRRIVARHGGRVWAESALDQGATFYFTVCDPADLPSGDGGA